uniref:Uncharacterized protein n=1 Tax=Lactuca sativa TaxID=4236 RepID=A0A9R1UNK3_LACSA|nr:hypothetical protein LSAT_V11C800430670 [Lactuca sativa]
MIREIDLKVIVGQKKYGKTRMSCSSSVGCKAVRRFNPTQRTHCDCGDLDSSKDCKFFDWVDPPLLNQWYKELLLQMHNGWNEDVVEQMEEAVLEVVLAKEQGVGGVVPGWSMMWFVLSLCMMLFLLKCNQNFSCVVLNYALTPSTSSASPSPSPSSSSPYSSSLSSSSPSPSPSSSFPFPSPSSSLPCLSPPPSTPSHSSPSPCPCPSSSSLPCTSPSSPPSTLAA